MERAVISVEPEDESLDPRVLSEFELEVPERVDPEDWNEDEKDDEEEDPAE